MVLILKRRIVILLFSVTLILLIVPIVNIFSASNWDAIKWQKKSFLYNIDFAVRFAARLLYPFGISSDPQQVIIGRDGWLYLGDQYSQTLTVDRRPPTPAEAELGREIGAATDAWDAYLSSKGVKLFRIMIGPNKGTIYPEYMPDWAKPASPNTTDALLAGTGETIFIDLRGSLREAKVNQSASLYYKTDTHWNTLGAGIAFRTFAEQVKEVLPELRWPSNTVYEFRQVVPRAGGDLARFLRLSANLSDFEPETHILDLPVETTQTDFDSNNVIKKGGNPIVPPPRKPVLVQSVGALNGKRVLWLRDSFGNAMSPLMAATFSEVLHLHWQEAIKPQGRLVQLVEDWKPDFVFFTMVERDSRKRELAAFPPPAFLPRGIDFKKIRTTTKVVSHHLTDGNQTNEYRLNGNDPYIVFALSDAIIPSEVRYLGLDLSCKEGSKLVPLQIFWLEDNQSKFNDENSVKFSFPSGQNLIDLHTLPKLKSAGKITRLRLDIASPKACTRFELNKPTFGILTLGAEDR